MMTATQLLALRELASIIEGDKPALADAVRAATEEIERLAAELQAVRDELATAYEEIILSRQSEGDTMADLLATREERDRLRDELDLIKLDAEGEQNAKSELYDALFPGEPDVEREVRWKWMIMEVKKLQAELDRLRSKGGE